MAPTLQEPKKKLAGGRKGKKAWKKNVDISNIEDAIDQIRTENILHGSAIVDKSSESLFKIDKKGDEKAKVSLKHRKLKIDQILDARSGVAGIQPIGRKNTTVPLEKEEDLAPGKKVKVVSKVMLAKINKKAKQIVEGKVGVKVEVVRGKKRVAEEGPVDLWGSAASVETAGNLANDYLAHLRPKKIKKPNLPDDRPAHVPAVKVSHSGSSYNPTFKDHQSLLQSALEVELEKERKAEELKKSMSYPPELDNIDDENFFDSEEEDEDDEQESDQPKESTEPKGNLSKKKTRTERNKVAAKIERAREEEKLKQEAKIKTQIHELDAIKKALDNQPAKPEKKPKTKPKKLGPVDFKPMPLEIALTEELPESLLKLKPEGNNFKDRFQSLQERSIIESRVPVLKRNFRRTRKPKVTERHDYKRFDAETFANM